MPEIIYMEPGKAVFIVCEYIPERKGASEAELADEISSKICRVRCGFFRDAQLQGIPIFCFNVESPYLQQLKQDPKGFMQIVLQSMTKRE